MAVFNYQMNNRIKHIDAKFFPKLFKVLEINNQYQRGIGTMCLCLMLMAFVLTSCANKKKQNQQKNNESSTVSYTAPVYEQPIYIPPTPQVEAPKSELIQELRQEANVTEKHPIQPTVTKSKYYVKGYDAGYDDGEDDALMDNGWGGSMMTVAHTRVKTEKITNSAMKRAMKLGIMTIKTETNNHESICLQTIY